ncbi:MAG TPA: hypothetical protein VHY34_12155 [Caulobacteraceae bacterium]|nr:hypothetical protein [Caulobacteraceae bacterium]
MELAKPLVVPDEDKDVLATVLGCKPDEVAAALVGHAQAALEEYLSMYLGRRAPTQGREILENRLSLLMQHALKDELPTDDQVARLFNSNQSQARTLIRNTISKHRFQLGDVANASAKKALEGAVKDDERFVLIIRSAYLVEWNEPGFGPY